MNYLIDGWTKQASTLARLYEHLREDDRLVVFDPDVCKVQNFDMTALTDVENVEGKYSIKGNCKISPYDSGYGIAEYNDEADPRRMHAVIDFDGAVDWCDCYVCFQSEEWILANCGDTVDGQRRIDAMLSRMRIAMDKGKRIYLGNGFGRDFSETLNSYDKIENKFITRESLEEILPYRGDLFNAGNNKQCKITYLVGTNGGAGKMSSAFRAKAEYERLFGERVALIVTEEIYHFLDNREGMNIYSFCRNFSHLSVEDEFLYLQSLVGKIISETRADRIIICAQGSFGMFGTNCCYSDTKEGLRLKGVWDTFIETAVGCDSIIICANYDRMECVDRMIAFFDIQNMPIDRIYVSPMPTSGVVGRQRGLEVAKGIYVLVPNVGTVANVSAYTFGLQIRHPNIEVRCDYALVEPDLQSLINSGEFERLVREYMAERHKILESQCITAVSSLKTRF